MKIDIIADIEVSSGDKIVYTKPKIKKIDVLKYYEDVSELMLPYLDKRLLSVIRCHQGVSDACFFKKHPTTETQNIEVFNDNEDEYFYVKNKKQLVYQAQMGTIEFHTWGSQVPNIDKPNMMVFDLDPDTKLSLPKLRQGVLHLKSVLDELGLVSFLKTSGGKGYHIVIPFSSCKNWNIFNNFANQVAELMQSKFPKLYTTNIRKNQREGKIFIDWLRNSKGATCVAPYSLRARDGACISWPIEWDDLEIIKPNEVNIRNYKKYIKNNPWPNFFEIKQGLK